MKIKSNFLASFVFSVFASTQALATPAGNWDFNFTNGFAGTINYLGDNTSNRSVVIQTKTFLNGQAGPAFTTGVHGFDGLDTIVTYADANDPNNWCKITVHGTAKEDGNQVIYNGKANYQANGFITCSGPTSLGSGGTFTVVFGAFGRK